MGEMADFALGQVWDEEDLRSDYRRGILSTHEAYEAGIIDELGGEYSPSTNSPVHRSVRCRHCNKADLHWLLTDKGWRTAELSGQIHVCPFFGKK